MDDIVKKTLREEEIRRAFRHEIREREKRECEEWKECLDHVWELFQHLKPGDDSDYMKAIWYFVYRFEFDHRVLPDAVYEEIEKRLQDEAKQTYADDQADENWFIRTCQFLGYK